MNYEQMMNNLPKRLIKVLIVDDEPEIREILSIFLKDYEIIEASNGAEAVEATKSINPML